MTKSHIRIVAAAAGTLFVFGAVAPTVANAGGRPLSTDLSGSEEVPPADPDGSGMAHITVNPGTGRLCYELSVENVDPTVAAHIHRAPAGGNGPVVVPFAAPNPTSSGCVDVARELAMEIIRHPEMFYVNVHNPAYPAGAVRGQLG